MNHCLMALGKWNLSRCMHDLVRDLACHISKWNKEGEASGSGSGVRHLSVSAIEDALHLTDCRTCLIEKAVLNLNILKDFEKLRALSFKINSGSKIKKKDWESLGNLKHLRFLNIWFFGKEETVVDLLPQIAKLYHLQTLNLLLFSSTPNFVLPEDFSNLVNLRYLKLDPSYETIGIIAGLGHLTNLQTLPPIDLKKDWGGRISELQNLNKLRGKLIIDNIDQIQNEEEARSVNLGAKSSLTALELRVIRNSGRANEILEALRPPDSLMYLTIANFRGTRFPTWLTSTGSLSNLVHLTLDRCERGKGELNMENFKSLRSLSLTECYGLTVAFPVDGFQCCKLLEELHIRDCYKVHSLPNLRPLTNLRRLSIENIGITPKDTSKLQGLDYLYCSDVRTHGFLLPETLSQDSPICTSLKLLFLSAYYDDDGGGHGDDAETIPLQLIQHFVALEHLWVKGYRGLKALPDWLGNMTSLRCLDLFNLPELEHLPSTSTCDRLSNLQEIWIKGCPLLRRYVRSTEVHEKWTKKIRSFS